MGFEEYGYQVRALVENVQKTRGINPEATIDSCKKMLEYAEKIDDERLLGFAYFHLGETYYLLNDVDQLFRTISRSLTYLENTNQHELIARAYNILAITSANRGNAPFAMDYYLNSLTYCNQYHLDEVGVMVNINIGTLYNSYGEYQKAQHYFEQAYTILTSHSQIRDYYTYLMNVYLGMANGYLLKEQLLKAQEYENRALKECFEYLDEIGQTCFLCFEARLYQSMGKIAQRDECMNQIRHRVHQNMIVLDVFDDFYSYCEMLFEIRHYDEMMSVLIWLEEIAKKIQIVYLQKKLLLIRIKYCRFREDHEAYLEACARFYELTELSEKENQYMLSSMLNMRYTLEETTKKRLKVEIENRMLQHKSETDALTGLSNRFRLNEYSEESFQRALDKQHYFAVEILDIDCFKQYNDNYGHQQGDLCLRRIASAIKEQERHGNVFCARYGGDEFVIIYEGYSKEQVLALAEELKRSIVDLNIQHEYSEAGNVVTISQGVCCDIPKEENKVWDYLHTADMMLYKGKKISRNSVHISNYEEDTRQ